MDYLLDVVPHLVPIIEKLDEKIKAKYPQENVAIIDKNNLVHMHIWISTTDSPSTVLLPCIQKS